MTKRTQILVIGSLILFSQILYFPDYISPLQWGQLKVSGQSCTCPDEAVVNGRLYLKSIIPDSLKEYDIDYSEIYVSEKPTTKIDPMGADLYIIKGQVIGKDRVSKDDSWNLKFRVDAWREVDLIKDLIVKAAFFLQVLLLLILTSKSVLKEN